MKTIRAAAMLALSAVSISLAAQTPATARNPLLRQYHEGEILRYGMTGTNDNWHYELLAEGTVKKDASGAYYEDFQWSHFVSDGKPVDLPPASQNFRQQLSLDPSRNPAMPDLSKVDPRLIGPITDLMTFYSDLWLVVKTGQLTKAGDHFYFQRGVPNSWADGTWVLTGEDAIDFDMTLKSLNTDPATGAGMATIVVRHVPPAKSVLHFAASWMEKPVADTPNNWQQVMKTPDVKFSASVGKESFDVELTVSLPDGKILSATLDNPVNTIVRQCDDRALTQCGPTTSQTISRRIQLGQTQVTSAPVR